VAVVWQRYQDMARKKAPFGAWGNAAKNDAEVVDVEAKDVSDAPKPLDRLPRQ
jgi:hypothetical protein